MDENKPARHRGGTRLGAGRKPATSQPILRRRSITATDKQYAQIEAYGAGNLSAGARRLCDYGFMLVNNINFVVLHCTLKEKANKYSFVAGFSVRSEARDFLRNIPDRGEGTYCVWDLDDWKYFIEMVE